MARKAKRVVPPATVKSLHHKSPKQDTKINKWIDELVQRVAKHQEWAEAKRELGSETVQDDYDLISSLLGAERTVGHFAASIQGHAMRIKSQKVMNIFDSLVLASTYCVLNKCNACDKSA